MSNEHETELEAALRAFHRALVEGLREYKAFRWIELKMLRLLNWLNSKLQ